MRGKVKHSDLIHRQVAYKEIYLKNRKNYPMPFSKYVVHHKDRNKRNNHVSNLQILTREEHNYIHGKPTFSGNIIYVPKVIKDNKKVSGMIFGIILFIFIIVIFNSKSDFGRELGVMIFYIISVIVLLSIFYRRLSNRLSPDAQRKLRIIVLIIIFLLILINLGDILFYIQFWSNILRYT